MCGVCGCGEGEARIDGKPAGDGRHGHTHGPHHHHGDDHHHGHGHDHGRSGHGRRELVEVEKSILANNDADADVNRLRFAAEAVLALNFVSSPGAGKTTLLTRTIVALRGHVPVAVIEGDQETANDAERIRETGAKAVQINTGRGCHLDADAVGEAYDALDCEPGSVLFIENVGNLVCPAAFDLGEACKVAILSLAEGEDKPIKYPDMFAASDLMILNKVDLAPYVDFDMDKAEEYARRVNPAIEIIRLSATTGEGFEAWIEWILAARIAARARNDDRSHITMAHHA
jgi:hydrogenase nickel incorporation protein HypB